MVRIGEDARISQQRVSLGRMHEKSYVKEEEWSKHPHNVCRFSIGID
jgi:hypothetical protein